MSFNAIVYHEVRDDLDLTEQTAVPLVAANDYAIKLPSALFLNTLDFKRQMTYLVEQDFHFLTMQEIKDYYENDAQLPEKSILISFDDAYQSLYKTAYPILKDLRIPATLFLISGWVFDQVDDFNPKSSQVMSWSELEAMSDVFELANHTHNLHNLIQPGINGVMAASFDELKTDLETCKPYVKHQDTFAYPFGFYDEQLVERLSSLGFKYAFTTKVGSNLKETPTLELNRALIYNQIPFELFSEIVNRRT